MSAQYYRTHSLLYSWTTFYLLQLLGYSSPLISTHDNIDLHLAFSVLCINHLSAYCLFLSSTTLPIYQFLPTSFLNLNTINLYPLIYLIASFQSKLCKSVLFIALTYTEPTITSLCSLHSNSRVFTLCTVIWCPRIILRHTSNHTQHLSKQCETTFFNLVPESFWSYFKSIQKRLTEWSKDLETYRREKKALMKLNSIYTFWKGTYCEVIYWS